MMKKYECKLESMTAIDIIPILENLKKQIEECGDVIPEFLLKQIENAKKERSNMKKENNE